MIFDRCTIPGSVRGILPFIPAATLAALIAPQVIDIQLEFSAFLQPRFIGWVGAMLVAWRTKNVFLTISSGLIIFWLMDFLL